MKIKVKKSQSKLEIFNFCHRDGKLFNSVFSMQIFLKPKINQINLIKLMTQNDRRKKGFKKMFAAIAFGFCSVKKESKLFNKCVAEIIEDGGTNSEAVRYCNGGN